MKIKCNGCDRIVDLKNEPFYPKNTCKSCGYYFSVIEDEDIDDEDDLKTEYKEKIKLDKTYSFEKSRFD